MFLAPGADRRFLILLLAVTLNDRGTGQGEQTCLVTAGIRQHI
jgi:hypothetical protein